MKTVHQDSCTQLLLDERGATHGRFIQVAYWSQEFRRLLRVNPGWETLTVAQREALDQIMLKVARIMCGDPNHIDHWRDVIGYSRLVICELEKERAGP